MVKEDPMRSFLIATFVVSCALSASAEEKSGLAANMKDAKVSLERGIAASKAKGVPISAKYEVENGKLQLSVYTAKGDAFSEVIVDHNTGKAAKTEAITSGEDLSAAKTQNEAMAKSKQSLHGALAKVLKANAGFRAVSIFPALKDGHPAAEITLTKGDEWKTVSETLD